MAFWTVSVSGCAPNPTTVPLPGAMGAPAAIVEEPETAGDGCDGLLVQDAAATASVSVSVSGARMCRPIGREIGIAYSFISDLKTSTTKSFDWGIGFRAARVRSVCTSSRRGQRVRQLFDDDDRPGMETQAPIPSPRPQPGPKAHERMLLRSPDRRTLEAVAHGDVEIADARARLEREKGTIGRERDDVDTRKAFVGRTVDHNQGLGFANPDKLGLGPWIAVRHRLTFLEQRHNGPRKIRMEFPKTLDRVFRERECDESTRTAELRGPSPLMSGTDRARDRTPRL